MVSNSRRRYSKQERAQILQDSEIYGVKATADRYNIPVNTLYSWRYTLHTSNTSLPNKKDSTPSSIIIPLTEKRVTEDGYKLLATIERALDEINQTIDAGRGNSKPHEWISKLTVQVRELMTLYNTMMGIPTRITEHREEKRYSVSDRLQGYIEALTTSQSAKTADNDDVDDVIDVDT